MRKIFIAALMMMLLLVTSLSYADEQKTAVVDMQKIFDNYREYSIARQKFVSIVSSERKKYEQRLSEAKTEKEKEELHKNFNNFCKETENTVLSNLYTHIVATLQLVTQEKGLQHISKDLTAPNGVDITQTVIDRLNNAPSLAVRTENNPKVQQPEQHIDKNLRSEAIQLTENRNIPKYEEKKAVKTEIAVKKEKPLPKEKAVSKMPIIKEKLPNKKESVPGELTGKTKSGRYEVQFGADYDDKKDIGGRVKKANAAGISSAYLKQIDKNGRIFYMARATASSKEEAQKIAQQLKALGFNSFTMKTK